MLKTIKLNRRQRRRNRVFFLLLTVLAGIALSLITTQKSQTSSLPQRPQDSSLSAEIDSSLNTLKKVDSVLDELQKRAYDFNLLKK
ncbi:MAG: hypothetical protein LBK47_05155 [Prevotellaceae bacterium]|jgi:hypothetical protein|nr:hypothetical protein [Prevotellaceae bacterium]